MGVKFKDLLQPEEISWDELRDKKIAVDASLMIYQFLSSIMQKDGTPLTDSNGNVTSHLVGIFSRVTNLMDKGLKLCFVFDGKAPELKNKERERRRERKNIASEKYEEAREKEDEEMMHRYSRQLSFLTHEMVEEAKELIKALGLPVIQAPSEAEAQAAYMCRKKDVWAVATQDADVLIHGAPKVLRNLTLSQKKLSGSTYTRVHPEILELNKVLDNLGIDLDQLIVIAILIGTDFNVGGVKGLGPKKALKLVQDGKSFDVIFKELGEIGFDWKEIFDVIKKMPVTDNYSLEWKDVDQEKVKSILVGKHDFSQERVESTLSKITKRGKEQLNLKKWF